MAQMSDSETRARKLKYWLFGIFVLAFAAVTAVLGLAAAYTPGGFMSIFGNLSYWLMVGAAAVVCVLGYFVLAAIGKK
jgi:hypothetical protein